MDIKRTLLSVIVDTIIAVIIVVMCMTTVLFFLNINSEDTSIQSIVIGVFTSSLITTILFQKYSSIFPLKLTMKGQKIIIKQFIGDKEIDLKDIENISKIKTMSGITGSITYKVFYDNNIIMLNNNRFTNLDDFMNKITAKKQLH
ncbi:hypothetical protein [Tepidibacter mesophilus]|uniref:hypothetical protein n=1 Tax=Tepidibacter mesophilus TaxID=655607 RepID=UPI000C078C34|nr:hypothetical protein [Tepidibacter mesophilus]